ncbi:DUF3971 domain-containing protein [Geobacter sp. SVR]|uniref:DUF3971 domain-containing protein n=1 Tax=Geobacter sp. SVR TaxID=2495594 RepID=UPI00143F0109|nr:DUF3971 domain-containing protein [Geobacter sp. SVR]BCS53154.1 hypothetical protein GSVR_14620 [Geobacter sp. SVR]GCF84539.1 hypothetical protein GSbR_11390 [Geobacter sp. SVR]
MPKLKPSYIKIPGLILLALSTLMISLAFFLPRLIDVNAYRNEIIDVLQKTLNRKVSFSRGEFSMHIGPTFTFDDVTVKEPDGVSDFLSARRITFHLALLPLLEKKVVLNDVTLDGAGLRLKRGSDGTLNIEDLLKPGSESYQIHLKRVQVRNGSLEWRDMFIGKGEFSARAEHVNLSMENLSRGRKGSFKLSCELPGQASGPALVSLSGTARLPAGTTPLTETELNANLDLRQADPGHFWPYYGRYIPFDNPGGRIDLATSFKGRMREFSAKGKLKLAGVTVHWPTVFHHPVNPRLAQLDYELRLNKNAIDMPSLQFSADGFRIKGSCRLQDITSSDLRITARATSEPFRLEGLRQWIPYGIIAKDASEYIEEHITGGTYKLDEGSLDGRISQIVHMEKGTNYNVLHIKGRVENGIVSYGPKVPTFTNIRAGLEMLGKDFIVSHATGTFGNSPFKVEGRITDYPLDSPCSYPFQMEITPHPGDVAWLSRLAGADRLNFAGTSTLQLRGSGLVSSYRLAGEWELKQANYAFPGIIRKPSGMPNHMSFSSILGPSDTRLTSLSYTLPPMALSGTAHLKYAKEPHLDFELQTNQFLLSESLPILSQWQTYRPHGKVQAHITGSGNPSDFAAMDYNGTVGLTSFAFLPGQNLKPISNVNGLITFKGNSLETSSISVRYGSSLISAKGRIRDFKNPEAEITLASPELFLKDIADAAPKNNVAIRRLQASLAIRSNSYVVRSLSGQLNSSNFNISGTYTGGSAPQANLSLGSSQLDIEDLLLLTKLTGQGAGPSSASDGEFKITLAADAGKYGKLPFTALNASLSRDEGIVYLQKLEAGIYGGKLSAKGRIGPNTAGPGSRYDLKFNLERVNAERLLHALDASREVTGTLNLEGEVTARGDSLAEIKKTALGNLRLRLEKGSLRKFSVLSKIFSILNLSQLLKFQLPDMVAGGMPYNTIKGSFAVRDGLLSTQDLFIRGDALNISLVGNADVVREELKFTIGVQPLQTVDKVVNRIPVVGWLLTGKDKAFLTAYFEAKGPWSNPRVEAIPVKSMAKGVLNIFRRVFELPVRLFTDTGEVILGK